MVENFSELLEKSLTDFKYKEGQIIKGTVLSIVNETVVVDVGLKAEGRIPIKEFHSPGEEHSVKVGDKYDVYLEKLENKEGEALLSRERARKEESWSNLTVFRGLMLDPVKLVFAAPCDHHPTENRSSHEQKQDTRVEGRTRRRNRTACRCSVIRVIILEWRAWAVACA